MVRNRMLQDCNQTRDNFRHVNFKMSILNKKILILLEELLEKDKVPFESSGGKSCNSVLTAKSVNVFTPNSMRRLQPGRTVLRKKTSSSSKYFSLEEAADQGEKYVKSSEG